MYFTAVFLKRLKQSYFKIINILTWTGAVTYAKADEDMGFESLCPHFSDTVCF
jgi:hypothetical protein